MSTHFPRGPVAELDLKLPRGGFTSWRCILHISFSLSPAGMHAASLHCELLCPPPFFFFCIWPKTRALSSRSSTEGRTGVAGRLSPQTDNPACSYNTEYRELRTSCLSDTRHCQSGCLIASRRVTLAGTADAPSVS